MRSVPFIRAFLLALCVCSFARGQERFPPDRTAPVFPDRYALGDRMIQAYLAREAEKIEAASPDAFLPGVRSQAEWERLRPNYKDEYFYMLGLSPLPARTPLHATVTRTLRRDGYVVDMLHYQSRPRLYVTANLYRPASVAPGTRLPAVFYVCGHSNQGRSGNKTAYQSHGIWFAKHGYICLTVDSLQLGEIAAIHHGTYREGRWWWHSRGYTPAGVECWNGIRGIDYLVSRSDVDPQRIAVTGISGGGAATFWIAAADERVRVAVPVSGMADLRSYVADRVINGHCDCMFLYNTFQWPWTRIAALVAPRPLLFANSDMDTIFPMDANDRVINRLKRVYSLYGASDMVDAAVSMGGHAYRQDLRQAAYRFINAHLKDAPQVVADSEADLVADLGKEKRYPIEPEKLRVFPNDSDLPHDELNTAIDRHFVPMAQVSLPLPGEFDAWRARLRDELRRVTFRTLPARVPPAKLIEQVEPGQWRLESEPGIEVGMQKLTVPKPAKDVLRIVLVVRNAQGKPTMGAWLQAVFAAGDEAYECAPRGVSGTRWTRENPPNYVERSSVLLGRTVDSGRVWDVASAARYLHTVHNGTVPVYVVGEGPAAVLAAYAALWEPEIAGVILSKPPLGHMQDGAPPLLDVLRVCDIPDVLGMLAPRPLTIYAGPSPELDKAAAIYQAVGAAGKFLRKQEP